MESEHNSWIVLSNFFFLSPPPTLSPCLSLFFKGKIVIHTLKQEGDSADQEVVWKAIFGTGVFQIPGFLLECYREGNIIEASLLCRHKTQ